eukprot:COSAG02_NODE_52250_length_309_cov_0.590476_1_plen_31_part_10
MGCVGAEQTVRGTIVAECFLGRHTARCRSMV